jgi:phosphatidylglycerophosphate synthase
MADTWSHRLVRPLVRPLIRIHARPNQVTFVHLLLGLGSLAGIALGDDRMRFWGGVAWLFACLLDRLDGELARIGEMRSAFGHRFDYLVDMWLASLFFVAIGWSVQGAHHGLAVAGGAAACAIQLINAQVAERFDSSSGDEGRVLGSRWGFDADDALYILGPLAWLPVPWRLAVAVLSAFGTAAFLVIFLLRLRGLRARQRSD